ncbi:ABC transporter [Nocardioides sp. Soil774]|uniref:ATP-binding cassette domain-containing protein n=1 Tax=Nocardioides sp. Soil774 TaxID=1736408 RepID=UPI0006F51D00|nr:ATP-binding cassette domain-containing protein [Nocardioides sp. Soil774]KRE96412.1 ABC transporter [Nocardioides sp. Soil774]
MTETTAVAVRQPTMVLSGISKSYAGVAALTDVSLEVLPGEVHALLGENGAGKSTLMGVASGTVEPDAGVLLVDDEQHSSLTPAAATRSGIAIVHQHPAVLPDLTVAENLRLALPAEVLTAGDRSERDGMRAVLDDIDLRVHLEERVDRLSVAQKHLLELAKAFAVRPRILILDEPTAPLGPDSVDLLFERVRSLAASGTAVIYITHRLAEVRLLAQRVTVLRDGRLRGSSTVDDVSDDQLLAMIVGRQLDATFPPKPDPDSFGDTVLEVTDLSGEGFSDVSIVGRRGEIIGISGVVGNGQSDLLRALAGLSAFDGRVVVGPTERSQRQLRKHSGYMPADRHHDGLMMTLSVRENAALSGLGSMTKGPFLSRSRELELVNRELTELDVRAPSMEAVVAALSGGNQQKVVLARTLLAKPAILLADEPTQGVDVGARAEIYRILREVAADGIPVVVASSDAKELEGLCDRVLVMSRGHVVADLAGDEVTEERMIRAAVASTQHTRQVAERRRDTGRPALRRFLAGDYAPVAILALVMVGLGAYVYNENELYLSAFNITSIMMLVAALGFISLGQNVALLTGGIDLSVGPLAGFLVVVASFFVNDGAAVTTMLLGFGLMIAAAVGTGLVNGTLIRWGNFTPVAATLTTYIALQGFSFLLRDAPEGVISADVTGLVMRKVGPVPVIFLALLVVVAIMEWTLRRSSWGHRVRAVGSHEDSARKLGVAVGRTVVGSYVITSLFTFLGSIVLLAQLGIGDPAQGVSYTLSSITAVVLGGTSLLGGRGTFVGTLLGAGLIVQLLNATTFLGLTQTWQYLFQGGLIVIAAVLYSRVRGSHSPA